MAKLPRGIRLNNPGNIEKGDPWQGLADDQSVDPRFCAFKSPEWGIRAIARILITYQDRHGLKTIKDMIGRWAPPHENPTLSYAYFVAERAGCGVNAPVKVTDYNVCRALIEGIIRFENGPPPAGGEWYDAATINRGLELAGIEPPVEEKVAVLNEERPIASTRTAQGAIATSIGGTAVAVDGMADVLPAIEQGTAQINAGSIVQVVIGVAIIGFALWTLWARVDDRMKGYR